MDVQEATGHTANKERVLLLFSKGLTYRKIAKEMEITVGSVAGYISRMRDEGVLDRNPPKQGALPKGDPVEARKLRAAKAREYRARVREAKASETQPIPEAGSPSVKRTPRSFKKSRLLPMDALPQDRLDEIERIHMNTVERMRKAEEVAPDGNRVNIMGLTSQTCRWPIGDPRDEDFGFCGCQKFIGSVYCAEHHKIAYRGGDENE